MVIDATYDVKFDENLKLNDKKVHQSEFSKATALVDFQNFRSIVSVVTDARNFLAWVLWSLYKPDIDTNSMIMWC